MRRPDPNAFPPTLHTENLHEAYARTYQHLQPTNFEAVGNCAICGVTFPSASNPNVRLHDPVPSNSATIQPHLGSLRWRQYNTSKTTEELGFDDYSGDSLLKGLVLDRRGILAPTPETNGHCL